MDLDPDLDLDLAKHLCKRCTRRPLASGVYPDWDGSQWWLKYPVLLTNKSTHASASQPYLGFLVLRLPHSVEEEAGQHAVAARNFQAPVIE